MSDPVTNANGALQTLATVQPGTISAYTDSVKTIATLLGGSIVTLAAGVNAIISHRNTKATKENTETQKAEVFQKVVKEATDKVEELSSSVLSLAHKVAALDKNSSAATSALSSSVDDLKKAIGAVSLHTKDTKEQLSGALTVQQAIEHRLETVETKAEIDRGNVRELIEGLKRRAKHEP